MVSKKYADIYCLLKAKFFGENVHLIITQRKLQNISGLYMWDDVLETHVRQAGSLIELRVVFYPRSSSSFLAAVKTCKRVCVTQEGVANQVAELSTGAS